MQQWPCAATQHLSSKRRQERTLLNIFSCELKIVFVFSVVRSHSIPFHQVFRASYVCVGAQFSMTKYIKKSIAIRENSLEKSV